MSDLINRQAAFVAAIEAADKWDGGYSVERAHIIEDAIKALPSAQPIRCGECVYWERRKPYLTIGDCRIWQTGRMRSDFCSEWRGKEDEQ